MHGRAASGNSRQWHGWKVSLALHAVLGVGILFTLWRVPTSEYLQVLNTKASGPLDDFCVTICEEPVRKLRPQPAPPPQRLPKEIIQPMPAPAANAGPENHVQTVEGTEPKTDNHNNNPGASGSNNFRSHESHLPVPLHAKSVVFVLDRSASMGIGNKMEVARREILATLARMSPASRFQVVVYNRQPELLALAGQKGMVFATERNLREVSNFLTELTPEGGNDHLCGLREAIALQPDEICLLSDADELSTVEVRTITNWNRGLACIHAVSIGTTPSPTMQLLARSNRGVCKMIAAK